MNTNHKILCVIVLSTYVHHFETLLHYYFLCLDAHVLKTYSIQCVCVYLRVCICVCVSVCVHLCVYVCVYLYVHNSDFLKVTKNQALTNAVQAQCDNISNLVVVDF